MKPFFLLHLDTGLFPVVFNLATRAKITSNATCGEDGPEQFCRLVEHVRRQPKDRIQCDICNEDSLDPTVSHPITNAIDGTNLWWQSPSIALGFKYHFITVTLDLQQVIWSWTIIVENLKLFWKCLKQNFDQNS